MASGSTQDISLLFGVDVGNDGSGSMKLIMDQLNSIVATINANPFKLKFEVDPASLNLIKSQIQEIHNLTGVKSFNSFNEMNDILGISASLDQIRDSSRQVAQVLSSMFVGVDGGASLFESHLERIRSLLDEINLKKIDVYASGGLTEMESNGLKNISVNIDSAVKGLVEFKQILTEILSVIQQINAKDFNVTNRFSVSKMDNQRKEVALYKNELIELFKVNEQLLGTLGTISNGSGFSTIKSALDATGNSNIYNLLTTLDRLKISIDSIKGIKSIAGLDTVKSQLMDLYNSLTAVFEKINTSGSMKVLLPDTSALQKASSDLAAFTSQQDKYNESVQRSVAQAVGANVPGITPNITGVSKQLSKITSETQTALNSIRAQIEKTFDLSTININSEALVAKLTNILTNISPLEQSLKQIGAQLSGALTINNAQFDTTKISESITKIKTEFETFKSDVISGMQEIQTATEKAFSVEGVKSYLENLNTLAQTQKEVSANLQTITSNTLNNNPQTNSAVSEVSKRSDAEKELKESVESEAKAEDKRKVSLQQFLKTYESLLKLQNQNTHMQGTSQYDNLTQSIQNLKPFYESLKLETSNIKDIFKGLDGEIVKTYRDAITGATQFKTALQNTSDGVKYQDVMARINQINTLMSGDAKVLAGTKEWNNLKAVLDSLSNSIDKDTNSFKVLETNSENTAVKISELMRRSKIEMQNFKSVLKEPVEKINFKEAEISVEQFVSKLNTIQRTLSTAKRLGITSDNNADFKALENYLAMFDQIRSKAADSGKSIIETMNITPGIDLSDIQKSAIALKDLDRAIIKARESEADRLSTTRESNKAEKERQALLNKSHSLISSMQSASSKWTAAQNGKTSIAYSSITKNLSELRSLTSQYEHGAITAEVFKGKLKDFQNEFRASSEIIKQAGENTKSFSDRMGNVIQRFGAWFGVTRIIMYVIRSIREMISASIELNDAFTQLQIVTRNSESTFKNFGDTVAEVAKRTAVSMTDIVSSATTYARLGYDFETATKIAEYTAKLQNVGDIGVEDAQNAITAILKAYDDIDADHIEDVMNKLVVTGNNFPISVSQIAEGMNNASSALAAAGNTFEQSVALLTAANTTIQDASKSSTGLRTIAARIRKTDSELESLGESMTTAKYDELVRSLTGLNIALVDVNGEYRSTYDIMADIASKWESMSTMEQAALADVVAGTRQQSVFFSLIGQFQEASGAMDSMANSANTLDEAYATYLDSTTAHINQFKAASQSLAANIFDSKFLSTMVDIGRVMLEFNDALVKTKTIFLALPAAFGISKFIKLKIAMAADMAQANTLSASLIRQKTVSDQLSLSISTLTAKQYEKVQSDLLSALSSGKLTYAEYAQLSSSVELAAGNVALETSNYSLAGSFQAVAAAIPGWGWFLIALTGVTVAIGALIKANEEMRKEFSQNTEEFNNSISPLEEYKKSIKEISESSDDMATKLSELGRIKDELSEKYDIQTGKIQNETQAVRDLNYELDKEIQKKRQIYLNENEEAYNKAVSQVKNFKEDSFAGNEIYGSFSLRTGDFQSDLKREKQGLNISNNILKLFDSTPDSAIGAFRLGTDAKNEIEYFKQLEKAYAKFGEIKRIKETNNSLTKDELELYGLVEKEYRTLKEELYGEDGNIEETILEYAKAQAEELIAMYPKASSSTEQWKKELFALADGDEFVISSINDLINSMEELNNSMDPTNLELVTSSLQLLEGQLDSVKESISTADEYFEDLAKTIKDNNDMDKFFTSSEIIELLDKYPELSSAILETTYGYKIEANALEELRTAKLEEQKTAIATQILETEKTLRDTTSRLESYKAEIGGINDLAHAKIALADIETKLSQLSELNAKKPITNPTLLGMKSMLEERRASLSGYIEMSNRIDELNQQLEKSKMQYTVLGSVFDDVTDKTKDTTSALNNQKSALKDLSDEYKDAQDAINDLIDLTMDMIKKQKELEKEALKEQLENYKKLIDKRKELIELEKDQYEFEKELKEQNRDLLEIQQELDALSVEGADYSLEDMKRKEELQDKLVEKQQDRTDFLYDHEVEVRKDALDKEKEAFEDNINTQIDAIEDYLKHEGWIRQQAIDLINGKSQEFYNNLYEYTMTYTKKSHYEFTKLWNDAYDALMKYGNGQIDVDMTLMYLINRIAEIENEINSLEDAINKAKSSASGLATSLNDVALQYDKARVSAEEFKDAIDDAKEKASSISSDPISTIKQLQAVNTPKKYSPRPQTLSDWLESQGLVYHDGGVVQHQGITKNSEVLAKLMAGEVVVTPSQADNFFNNTLPKMVSSNTINNNSMSPTISIGDINITGNADASIVSQIKSAQQEIVNSVFKVINGQKNIFNGGRIK